MAGNANDRVSYLYSRDPSIDRRCRPRPERKVNLFPGISEESTRESGSSASSSSTEKTDTASVYLRLRPTKKRLPQYSFEGNVFKTWPVDYTPNSHQKDVQEKQFTFSNIFSDLTTQAGVYDSCCYNAIENEENLTVLTYGTSGSGKTFTLLGLNTDNPGIIPRAIEHIFAKYNVCKTPAIKLDKGNVVIVEDENYRLEGMLRHSLIGKEPWENYLVQKQRIEAEHTFRTMEGRDSTVFIWVSFAEIYNENVYDLLAPPDVLPSCKNVKPTVKRKNLKIISNDGNAFIKDLRSIHCRNSEDAYQLLAAGLRHVTYAATNINAHSSRSHCIFIIEVIQFKNQYDFDHVTYKFCDLAGSERQKKTDNAGSRLKEAQSINNSLMVLGRCLDAVYHNNAIVPIRDSKLTVLLQAPLLGKEKITMIVNMMPTLDYYEENLNVLNFASMAKQIVYKMPEVKRKNQRSTRFSWFISHAASSSPKVGGDKDKLSDDSQVSILLDENDRLKQENEGLLRIIENLQSDMVEREMEVKRQLIAEHEHRVKRSEEIWNKRLDLKTQTFATDLEYELKMAEEGFQKSLELTETNYKKLLRHRDSVWERKFAELEALYGTQLERPTEKELNDCSFMEPTHTKRASMLPPQIRKSITNNSQTAQKNACINVDDDDDDDCSIVYDELRPSLPAPQPTPESDDDDCSFVCDENRQSMAEPSNNSQDVHEIIDDDDENDDDSSDDDVQQQPESQPAVEHVRSDNEQPPSGDTAALCEQSNSTSAVEHFHSDKEQPRSRDTEALCEQSNSTNKVHLHHARKSESNYSTENRENEPPEKRNRTRTS